MSLRPNLRVLTSRARVASIAALAVLGLVLLACGDSETPADSGDESVGTRIEVDGGSFVDITPGVLRSWLDDKDFLLVNVHVPYEEQIEPTDEFVPFDDIEGRLDAFPQRDAKIVVYCRSGSMSAIAAETLVELGYTNVWNLDGGMGAWREAGYPLATDGG
jgi:rhodanese-related sulfurtransferase